MKRMIDPDVTEGLRTDAYTDRLLKYMDGFDHINPIMLKIVRPDSIEVLPDPWI